MRIDAEIVFLERERFGTQCPILEIEDALGVEGLAFVACLEMEMGSVAATGVAGIADQLASANGVAATYQGLLQMSIVGLKSVEVSNDDKVTVPSRMFRWLDDSYHTVESGVNVVTDTQGDVYSFVGMSSTIFESRTHLPLTWEAVDMQRVNQQKVDCIGQRYEVDTFNMNGFSTPIGIVQRVGHHWDDGGLDGIRQVGYRCRLVDVLPGYRNSVLSHAGGGGDET